MIGEPNGQETVSIEQLMHDPSKGQEIVTHLEREDSALLKQLIQWIDSQKSGN